MNNPRRLIIFVGIAILLMFLYTFVIDTFKVGDNTMINSHLEKDKVVILKASYGITEPFFSKLLFTYSMPKKNHVIAFHIPTYYDVSINEKPIKISRCIGLPGDTVHIKDKTVFINGNKTEANINIQFQYRIVTKSGLLDSAFFKKYNITNQKLISESENYLNAIYDFTTSNTEAAIIAKDESIASIRILQGKTNYTLSPIFPISQYYSFSKDNFGPVLIPYKGWVVPINSRNIDLYKRVISQYENNDVKIDNDIVLINGNEVSSYTFAKNYYFVLDDNRDHADDSRHWGFLPEDHIIGKVF